MVRPIVGRIGRVFRRPGAEALGAMSLALTLLLGPGRAVAAQPGTQPARDLALLIGVSRYPRLPPEDQLQGPENDVALWRGLLASRGFQVTVLGGAHARTNPTRAAIIAAMRRLASAASPGDFVFLLFSGHGSQQPEGAVGGYPRKPDGMDETFLPADVGRWQGDTDSVAGALLDHEVGSLINAIRNRGAFVWSVFDSCHSATMTRAARVHGERDRRVLPQELGVPLSGHAAHANHSGQNPAIQSSFIAPIPLQAGAGGGVAFYAAQTTETTPELPLPEDATHQTVYGLFSFSLAQAVLSAPAASYRQLAQQILQSYAAMNRASPTPLFEGDLDRPAFGAAGSAHPVRQWQLQPSSDGIVLAAGVLNQVGPGALLLVLPSPTAGDDQALGVIRVAEALDTTSRVDWVRDRELLKRAGWTSRTATLPSVRLPAGAFARLVDPGLTFNVRIARPLACREPPAVGLAPVCVAGEKGDDPRSFTLALEALDTGAKDFPPNVTVVDPSSEADIRPLVYRDRLWLAPPGGELVTGGAVETYSIPVPTGDSAASNLTLQSFRRTLFDALAREARAINLARVANDPSANDAVGLDVTLSAAAAGSTGIGTSHLVSPGSVPTFKDGDLLTFVLTNRSRDSFDVTMLDIGARFGIEPVYPLNGESNRLTPGASVSVSGSLQVQSGDAGRETMLIIATLAEPGEERQDFSDLAQPPLVTDRGMRSGRKLTQGRVSSLLWEAAFGGQAGTRTLRTFDPAALTTYRWNTVGSAQ